MLEVYEYLQSMGCRLPERLGIHMGEYKKKTFSFLSDDKKTTCYGTAWYPAGLKNEPGLCKGIVQIIHGMQEYIERYDKLAGYLASRGYLVVGHDLLGHGRTAATADDRGFFCKGRLLDALIQDIHFIRKSMEKQFPEQKYYMIGHSMGSYLLRCYLCRYGQGIDAAVIMGTGHVLLPATAVGKTLCHIMALVKGWYYRSTLVTAITFSGPYGEFDSAEELIQKLQVQSETTGNINSWLTRDEEVVRQYAQDDNCNYMFTLNGYFGLYQAIQYAGRLRNMRHIPKDLPIILLSGDRDPVGKFGDNVRWVESKLKKSGVKHVETVLYKGARHEIINETDWKKVYYDIWHFLSQN